MKKLIPVLVFLGCLFFSHTDASAQTPQSEYRQALQTYFDLSGTTDQYLAMIDENFDYAGVELSEDTKNRIRKESLETLYDMLSPVLEETIAIEDLQKAGKIFAEYGRTERAYKMIYGESSLGKRIYEGQLKKSDEAGKIGTQWTAWTLSRIMKASDDR